MSTPEEISKRILHNICVLNDYRLNQAELASLHHKHDEEFWEKVGDILGQEFEEGGMFDGQQPNIFAIMDVLDFRMQVYMFAGERAILKKFGNQFNLANLYSDQGGLSRKFELYETLVSESFPLIKKRNADDQMHWFFTRALNRLAQLTLYWKGDEKSRPLWTRLADHAMESSGEEKLAIRKVIVENGAQCVIANHELFQS